MIEIMEIDLAKDKSVAEKKKILLFSDIHVISLKQEEKKILNYEEERLAKFQEQGISNTKEQFLELVSFLRDNSVDLLVFCGDIIDCPSDGNLEFLTEYLKQIEIPYLFALGNHDWNFSWNYLEEEMKQRYLAEIEKACHKNMEIDQESYFDSNFLVIDSSSNCITRQALDALKALPKEKRTFVIMHIPFYTKEISEQSERNWGYDVSMGGKMYPMDNVTKEFYQELLLFKEGILLCGHVHSPSQAMLSENVMQVVTPAGCEGKALLLQI